MAAPCRLGERRFAEWHVEPVERRPGVPWDDPVAGLRPSRRGYGIVFGCCCLIFSRYFWKKNFWMSSMLISRPWM